MARSTKTKVTGVSAKRSRKPAARSTSSPAGLVSLASANAARLLLPQAIPILKRYPGVIGVGVGLRRNAKHHAAEAVFVVNVSKKRDPAKGQVPPTSVLGIPVDVQETCVPSLRGAIAGGGEVRRHATSEVGHIALMARDGAGAEYALTAYHALGREVFGTLVRMGDPPSFDVEAQMFVGGFDTIGQLVAAEFDGDADIACVKLDAANHMASPVLFGTAVRLGVPMNPMNLQLGTGVQMVVPGAGIISGAFVHYPIGGSFLTEDGIADFTGLAQFQLAVREVPHGWSGSILFEPSSSRPIAVLSFAADGAGPGGDSYAYGFPLNAHYQNWGLRPV